MTAPGPRAPHAGTPRPSFAVYRGVTLLGTSALEQVVVPRQRAAGRFHPTPAFRGVVHVFTKYRVAAASGDAELLHDYVRALERLGLSLWAGGERTAARVDLISTWGVGVHVLHVSGSDQRLWRWRE